MQQHTEESLSGFTLHELHLTATYLAGKITKAELHDKLLDAFPLKTGQEYIGSLANHFRGRLKYDGVEDLIDRMDKCSLRCLIIGLSKDIS